MIKTTMVRWGITYKGRLLRVSYNDAFATHRTKKSAENCFHSVPDPHNYKVVKVKLTAVETTEAITK